MSTGRTVAVLAVVFVGLLVIAHVRKRLMPSTRPARPAGLEVWLRGSRVDLAAARAALEPTFTVTACAALEPLAGGTYAQYLRVTPRVVTTRDTPSTQEHEQCEIPFPSPSSGT